MVSFLAILGGCFAFAVIGIIVLLLVLLRVDWSK